MIFKLQFSFPMQPDIQASSDFGLSFSYGSFPSHVRPLPHTPPFEAFFSSSPRPSHRLELAPSVGG
ncbi:hypothetical protein V8C40DRAFT_240265 [Trichoderma camerunense]